MTQYYVSTTGNNSNNGLTTATAWLTLTRAGSAGSVVTGGDFVNVQPGNYGNQLTFKNGTGKASKITYRNDPAFPKWSAQIHGTSGLAWKNQGSYVVIDGFYVTGPSCTCGILTDPFGNTALGTGAHTDIKNCKIVNICTTGTCGSQGGIRTSEAQPSSCTVKNCIIGNIAGNLVGTCNTTHGIYIAGQGDTVENCLVYNCASVGIQQWHGARASHIVNNTTWGSVHGILIGQGDSNTNGGSKNNFVANNISRNNTRVGIYGTNGVGTGSNIYRNNCCFNNPEANFHLASTDLNANPITSDCKHKNWLADGSGDYHLSATSNCRNAGVDHGSASLGDVIMPTIDLDNNTRPLGGAYDIGCYEFVEGVTDTTAPSLSTPTGAATGTTTANCGVTTNEANGTLYCFVTTSSTVQSAATVKASGVSQAIASVGTKAFAITGLTASTTYYANFMHEDAAGNQSTVVRSAAFTTSAIVDTTAPTLTLPTAAATGVTTAHVTVTTDEANGTLFTWITVNAAETGANVIANGASQAVTATGVQSSDPTGLTGGTTYYAHFVHRDAAGNASGVSNSGAFTTDTPADVTPPTLSLPTGTATGPDTATIGVTTNEGNGIIYYWVTINPTETAAAIAASGTQFVPTTASGKVFSWTGLDASTTYYAHFVQDDAALNRSNVVHSSAFTTSARPSGPNTPGAGGSERRTILHR